MLANEFNEINRIKYQWDQEIERIMRSRDLGSGIERSQVQGIKELKSSWEQGDSSSHVASQHLQVHIN